MFENKSNLIEKMNNPDIIAKIALDEMEDRMGGKRIIADPNSPFCHLLEFGSSIAAGVISAMDEKLPIIYAKRAESMEDLYQHMSDFDYLSMYSTPSHTVLRMFINKQYLVDNALNYNNNYKLVRIPEDTEFLLGKYPFHLYYPINILINNYTKTFTTVFDSNTINPLHELSSNVIEKYDFNYQGMDYLMVDFPVYQFAKSTIEETLVAEAGFAKKINYNNKFYAIRLFSYSGGKYTELAQSQSKLVYDATVPTALVRVLPDEQKIKIVIPQIYFDKDMLGSKLLIEVYTTQGELDIDTSNITNTNIGYTFKVGEREDATYSNILKSLPFDLIFSLAATKITGGSNSITVDELRNRVVNNTLYSRVPITEGEIENFLNDSGFYVKKYLDNVTDREYHAYRVLKDETDSIIPSLTLQTRIKSTYGTDSNYPSIIYQNADNSITILPSTLYEYDSATNCAVPVSAADTNYILSLAENDKEILANVLNNKQYLRSPFHMRISFNSSYPQATSYDLFNPSVDKVMFEEDNYEMTEKMMMFSATISAPVASSATTGVYTVDMVVIKSDDVKNIDESNLVVYVTTHTNDGNWVGTTARHISTDEQSGRSIYRFEIVTNYHLTLKNEIGLQFPNSTSVSLQEQLVNLTADYHVVFMINRNNTASTVVEPSSNIISGVPANLTTMNVAISRQYLTLTLGSCLSDVIKNDLEVASAQAVYATYDHDVPARYEEDVYKYNDDGILETTIDDDGNLHLVLLHEAGEQKVDDQGELLYEHRIGDIVYDLDGQPVIAQATTKDYYITAMFLDAKIFFSDRTAESDFQKNLYTNLESYFDTIRVMQDQLLERTNIYFRCVRSTGYTVINRGDNLFDKQNIEMSFKIVCYVPSYVKQSESIQNQITEMTCSAIEESLNTKTVSMLDIFNVVKEKMSDYIDHFDLLGINGDTTLQTFVIVDTDSQPSVARKLELTSDNMLSLNKQIEITYIALDSNTASSSVYNTY